MSRNVQFLRKKIDRIDDTVLRLIQERAQIAKALGAVKIRIGKELYDPVREEEILRRLRKKSRGPFPADGIQSVFKEIISGTRSLEGRLEIAYLGPEGSNTHMAALKHFGSSVRLLSQTSVSDVFAAVEKKKNPYGIVAVENSIEGGVGQTLDLFIESPVTICAETYLDISHSLLSREKRLERIRKIYSHPQALAQCRNWLRKNLPWARLEEVPSTSFAAQKALHEKGTGAVASPLAARLYNLPMSADGIEDRKDNITRFLIIGRAMPGRTGRDKTSLLLSLKDEPGTLLRAMKPFSRHGVNMTKIESRPLKRRPWEYLFFIDIDGHVADPMMSRALTEVEKECLMLKVLGSYPRADMGASSFSSL